MPLGASWVEATIQTSGFDTTRRFFVDAVQVQHIMRICIKTVLTYSNNFEMSRFVPYKGLKSGRAL